MKSRTDKAFVLIVFGLALYGGIALMKSTVYLAVTAAKTGMCP